MIIYSYSTKTQTAAGLESMSYSVIVNTAGCAVTVVAVSFLHTLDELQKTLLHDMCYMWRPVRDNMRGHIAYGASGQSLKKT